MKKYLSVCLTLAMCIAIVFAMPFSTFAASVSSSGNSTVTEGSEVTVVFSVSSEAVTSGSVEISCSTDFTIVSGKWLLSGTTLADFSGNKGVFAFSSATALGGKYFQVTVRANNVAKAATVKATVQLKNGSTSVGSGSSTKTIQIICKNHSYGAWTETQPTCTKAGSKVRTCSTCGTVDTVTIAALGHKLTGVTTTKDATCLEAGEETGTCTVCNQTVTRAVAAKGHSFGSWIVTTASTCTEAGVETRTCMACQLEETQAAELAAHVFGDDVTVLREATISTPGLVRGVCVNCGEEHEQNTPCGFADETTGIELSCEEGAFRPNTEITVNAVEPQLDEEGNVIALLPEFSNITTEYTVYEINGTIGGEATEPLDYVTIEMPIPEEYTSDIALALIKEDGTVKFVSAQRSEDGKTLIAETKETGKFVICHFPEPVEEEEEINIWFYVAIGEGVLVLVLLILLILKKKKKAESKQEETVAETKDEENE